MEGGFIAMVFKERNGSNAFLVPGNLYVYLYFDHGKNGTVGFPVYFHLKKGINCANHTKSYFRMKFVQLAV